MNTARNGSSSKQDGSMFMFNSCAVIFLVLTTIALAVFCSSQWQNNGQIWAVFVIGFGALAGGGLLGFLSAPTRDEEKRFESYRTFFGSLAAGFAASDLARDDSLGRRFLESLSIAAGLDGEAGLIVAVLGAYASAGFITLYVNKRTLIDLATARAQQEIGLIQISQSSSETDETKDASKRLEDYLFQDSGKLNVKRQEEIISWMRRNDLRVSVESFLALPNYSEKRALCVKELNFPAKAG